MTELKPCPFCGGSGKYHGSYFEDDVCEYVSCTRCNASTPLMDKKGESIEWWNRRANPWHTKTPTEEGDYLLVLKAPQGKPHYFPNTLKKGKKWRYVFRGAIIAWQKITPFEANKEQK